MFPKPSRKAIKRYEKFLAPGEELNLVAHIGNRYYWSIIASLVLIFLVLAFTLPLSTRFNLLPLYVALPLFLSSTGVMWPLSKIIHLRHSLIFLFTNRRVIIKKGIFSLSVTTAPYDKITHIVVEEKFLERLFYGTGTIVLHTAGPTPVEMKLPYIENPLAVKNLLDDLIHQEKRMFNQPVSQPWPQASIGGSVVRIQ